jgi:hypothetical protein
VPPGSDAIREFFRQYERGRNTVDTDLIASQYAESFMYAGPDGVRNATKADVRAGFAKGAEWLRSLGHTSTTLTSLEESSIDEHYAVVRATFMWHFEQVPGRSIDVAVDSTFIVHSRGGSSTIVFQHEHEDFLQSLRKRGVAPLQA